MDFLFIVLFMLLVATIVISAGYRSHRGGGLGRVLTGDLGGTDLRVSSALRKYGVTIQRQYRVGSLEIDDEHGVSYHFIGVDKAGHQVSGEVWIPPVGAGVVHFDSTAGAAAARRFASREGNEEASQPVVDFEEQVRLEVAKRLDALQQNRDAFMSSDTDGDGMVDADEWNATRRRIEDEVRAELGAAAPVPQDSPSHDGTW